jgi:NTE family protein
MLFDLGRDWADSWLDQNFDSIGVRSTLDLDGLDGDAHLPLPAFPAADAAE